MTTEIRQVETVNSVAEDELVRLFCETLGVDEAEQLCLPWNGLFSNLTSFVMT